MKERYISVVIILMIVLFSVIGLALMTKKVAVNNAEVRDQEQLMREQARPSKTAARERTDENVKKEQKGK